MHDIKIFASTVDIKCQEQINDMANLYQGAKIRVMPDCHAGKGSVIGFTAQIKDLSKLTPITVGVDIGCGVACAKLSNELDLPDFDKLVHERIPTGIKVCTKANPAAKIIEELKCFKHLQDIKRLLCAIGSLGSGNHFIEVDQDIVSHENYLIVHTGSRNLGVQVCNYYMQNLEKIEDYVYDVQLVNQYAHFNRMAICQALEAEFMFESIHNYYDAQDSMIRKGAISAKLDEKVIIPLNMRDGVIIGTGLGNEDYNNSAPHGAGRIMSRTQAKKAVSLAEFKQSMEGIYSTTVQTSTIDEAPQVYKKQSDIFAWCQPTIKIEKTLKPIYNFKGT